jgi:hypothetical protein
MTPRRQKNPARDAKLTKQLHRLLKRLKPPPRPVDGVQPAIIGWVQIDVRFLK